MSSYIHLASIYYSLSFWHIFATYLRDQLMLAFVQTIWLASFPALCMLLISGKRDFYLHKVNLLFSVMCALRVCRWLNAVNTVFKVCLIVAKERMPL
jgi:hypothetical protein